MRGKWGDTTTTRQRYDLETLYNNPYLRHYNSKVEEAAALLISGADINTRDEDGATLLMWAADEGATRLVKALLAKGAELDAKNNNGGTAPMLAGKRGYVEVVKILIDKGADISAKDNYGRTLLSLAASGTNLEEDQEAIDSSRVRVWYADSGGTIDVINLLIEKGLDVNEGTADGYTPLMAAAQAGVPPVVKLLIQKGADVNAKTKDGWTALMRAATASREWRSTIQLLLERGADINAKTKDGRTALAIASSRRSYGYRQIVELLKSHGGKE